MIEAAKFLATGVTNTAVDFAVLNLLIVIFGISQGDPKFIAFKVISYIVAATNSFILNKWWVFKKEGSAKRREIGSFAAVNLFGLILNGLVSYAVFHFAASLFANSGAHLLANVGALAGTLVVLIFNFLSYKFLVFNK